MRRALIGSLLFLFTGFCVAGCDNGAFLPSGKVPSKLKVSIERRVSGGFNQKLTVYAMDFHKEGRTLNFTCPCYLASTGTSEAALSVKVEESFKITTLPDAEYSVKVTYWTPGPDGNTEVQFQIAR